MKTDICSFCKGKLYEGKTEFVAKVGGEVITIKGVPAYVCDNCGDAYFTPKISRKSDEVMKAFNKVGLFARSIAAGEVELNV